MYLKTEICTVQCTVFKMKVKGRMEHQDLYAYGGKRMASTKSVRKKSPTSLLASYTLGMDIGIYFASILPSSSSKNKKKEGGKKNEREMR